MFEDAGPFCRIGAQRVNDLFGKCEQIHSFLRICLHLLKKYVVEYFFFCTVFADVLSLLVPKVFFSGDVELVDKDVHLS